MLPLALLKNDETKKILKISGDDTTKKHLANLGFVPDSEIKIINSLAGNLIVNVKGSRIAIDEKLARNIFVE